MTNNGRKQLISDEGYRQFVYPDSEGILTVGIGRNLEKVGLTREEANYLFENDLKRVANDIRKSSFYDVYNRLNGARKDVLKNMTFQMGISGVELFKKMLAALRAGDYDKVATEMLDSKWAKQTPERANRLAKIMRTGIE